MNFKKSISVALAQRGENQKQLAAAVGWTESGLSLAMKRNSLPMARLQTVADYFGMPVSELIKLGE